MRLREYFFAVACFLLAVAILSCRIARAEEEPDEICRILTAVTEWHEAQLVAVTGADSGMTISDQQYAGYTQEAKDKHDYADVWLRSGDEGPPEVTPAVILHQDAVSRLSDAQQALADEDYELSWTRTVELYDFLVTIEGHLNLGLPALNSLLAPADQVSNAPNPLGQEDRQKLTGG